MLIHVSKAQKQDPLRPSNQPTSFDKSRDAKDGLHICRHCDKPMCDWSSLRKHIIEKRCPVLFGNASITERKVAELVGAAPAAPTSPRLNLQEPYASRPSTITAICRCGDNVAFHLPDRKVLAQHCALCHQWITDPSKMKQHYRLSHAEVYQVFMNDAAKLCSKFNSLGSPCLHCGSKSKESRQHPSKCTVLWQLCVLHLYNLRYGGGLGNVRMFRPWPRQRP